jgi:SDR family mycofactocin-dependent oxidoreductase
MGRVDGKVAFITGAGQGQGRSHAVRLASEGADIIATDICAELHPRVGYRWPSAEDLEETGRLVEKEGRRCITAIADVRDRHALEEAVSKGTREFGYIDTVIANAGVATFHNESLEIEDEIFDLIVAVNLKGVWNTIAAAVPAIIASRRPGSVILTSSAAGLRGQVGYAHYVAAKHGVTGLTRAFANELAKHRIRVNSVHPTGIGSPGMGAGAPGVPELFATNWIAAQTKNVLPAVDHPLDATYETVRYLEEIDISQAVLWLASDEARYVTGVQLPVDGGNVNRP